MKRQAFQPGEIRDENDAIIREGAYGKKSAFATADNKGILDYIINNFDALKEYADGNTVPVSTQADLPAKGDPGKKYVTNDSGQVYYYDGEWKELKTEIEQLNAYDAKKYAKEAAASKEAAALSASSASNSQKDAANSADAAKTSETNAKASETNAKTSETSASTSATSAKSWAEDKDSPDGVADTDSPTGYTQSAKSWALAAQTSAASASAHLDEINRPVYYLDSDGCLCEKIFVEVTE